MNIRKPAIDVTWDDWNKILDTNLRGSFFVAQAVAKAMIERRYGRIINIGSVTSVAGYAGLGPYGASRGGIRQLTMSLADDWGPHGITVNCLAPGWFRDRTEQDHVREQRVGRLPLRSHSAKASRKGRRPGWACGVSCIGREPICNGADSARGRRHLNRCHSSSSSQEDLDRLRIFSCDLYRERFDTTE